MTFHVWFVINIINCWWSLTNDNDHWWHRTCSIEVNYLGLLDQRKQVWAGQSEGGNVESKAAVHMNSYIKQDSLKFGFQFPSTPTWCCPSCQEAGRDLWVDGQHLGRELRLRCENVTMSITTEDHNSDISVNIDKVEDTKEEGGKYFALISAIRGLQTGELYEDSRFELLSQHLDYQDSWQREGLDQFEKISSA